MGMDKSNAVRRWAVYSRAICRNNRVDPDAAFDSVGYGGGSDLNYSVSEILTMWRDMAGNEAEKLEIISQLAAVSIDDLAFVLKEHGVKLSKGRPDAYYTKWTKEDTQWLISLRKQGLSFEEIAEIMGRTKYSVVGRYNYWIGQKKKAAV